MIAASEPESKERPMRRDPAVFAHACHKCGSDNTRVVRTMAIVRYCKCRACSHTWTQSPARDAG